MYSTVSTKTGCKGLGHLAGTWLDPRLAGKDIVIPLPSDDGSGITIAPGVRIDEIPMPWVIRRQAFSKRGIQLSPMLSVFDQIIGCKDEKQLVRLVRDFSRLYANEVHEVLNNQFGRPAHPFTGALVGIPDISDDPTLSQRDGDLLPGEIGIPMCVIQTLNNNGYHSRKRAGLPVVADNGDYVLVSRWPYTYVFVAKVRILDIDSPVLVFPSSSYVTKLETKSIKKKIWINEDGIEDADFPDIVATTATDRLDGDHDGDTFILCCPQEPTSKKELEQEWKKSYSSVLTFKSTSVSLDWRDYEDDNTDEMELLKRKNEQKNFIGMVSSAKYAGMAFLSAIGSDTQTLSDWRETMTEALEKCFDLKHGIEANPRYLVGLLQGKKGYTLDKVLPHLKQMGINIAVISSILEKMWSRGFTSLREAACTLNPAYKIMHGMNSFDEDDKLVTVLDALKNKDVAKWFVKTLITGAKLQRPGIFDPKKGGK